MSQHPVYRFDEFLVDPDSWKLCRGGDEVHLEPVVLKLLIYLIANRDRLVTRQELMDTVWGDTVISESALSQGVARLRKALGDDSAHPRYLETVHSQGFRFVAEVEEGERPERSERRPSGARSTGMRLGLVLATASVVLLIAAILLWKAGSRDEAPGTDDIRSLAVLPLRNLTGDPGQDYYADGLQDILITELSQVSGLRVTSRQSTRRYRDSEQLTTDIAAELGVDAVVEGSLLAIGSSIEVTIQLVHGKTDEHLWAERYSRETPYVFDLVAEVANAIDAAINAAPIEPKSGRVAGGLTGPVDPVAIDLFSLGLTNLDRFSRDGIRSAIDQFEQAVAIEPKFALAWGHLAAAHAMHSLYGYAPPRESIEKARVAALRAVEADDRFYIGYSTLGWVRLWTGDMDGACESFKEALRLNPSAPYALHGDADCLMLAGRMDESIARTREVLLVGPFSAMHNRPLPYHLFLAGRYDEALTAAIAMQERVPGFSVHWLMARIYWQQGLLDKALDEERLEFERRGDLELLAALEEGLDAGGPQGAMRAIAAAMVARASETYVDPFRTAEVFARAGLADEALEWLGKAVDYGSYEITYMAFEPEFDILRDDARFQELAARVYGKRL
jgi:TolB-like protein/DNA-binding winged helix-turn-helix (wHTH) protein